MTRINLYADERSITLTHVVSGNYW